MCEKMADSFREHRSAALQMPTGSGKTELAVAVSILLDVPLLFIVPLNVITSDFIARFDEITVRGRTIRVVKLAGRPLQADQIINIPSKIDDGTITMVITSPEGVSRKSKFLIRDALRQLRHLLICLDECHLITA